MIILRKHFSKEEKDDKISPEELENLANKGIVAGTGSALVGGTALALHRAMAKKHGEKFLKDPKNINARRIALAATIAGTGIALGSGVAKHKSKKLKKKRNENKA